jgi:hypothetical protein
MQIKKNNKILPSSTSTALIIIIIMPIFQYLISCITIHNLIILNNLVDYNTKQSNKRINKGK